MVLRAYPEQILNKEKSSQIIEREIVVEKPKYIMIDNSFIYFIAGVGIGLAVGLALGYVLSKL